MGVDEEPTGVEYVKEYVDSQDYVSRPVTSGAVLAIVSVVGALKTNVTNGSLIGVTKIVV